MKRLAALSSVSLSLLAGTAGVAYAQAPPTLPPPDAPPAAAAAPPPAAAPTVAAAPSGSVRLHFHTFRDKGNARIYARQADGRYSFVCATPCTADIPANTPLRATYNDKEEDPHDFDSSARVGEEISVEIKGPSIAPVVGGAIMMGVGGATIISGVILVALSDTSKGSSLYNLSASQLDTLGYVCIGVGAALTIAGIIWFATRSGEPRIEAYPYRGEERYDERGRRRRSRAETFLEDQALATPRDPLAPLAPAPTPLSWRVAF